MRAYAMETRAHVAGALVGLMALDLFGDMETALAAVIGGSAQTAGWLLGGGLVLSFLLGGVLVLGREMSAPALLILVLLAAILALVVGWWEPWMILLILVGLIAAVTIPSLFPRGAGGGM